ncbi:MAG: DUF1559 domain-containing protein [Phycisphaerae bacterium]|nr:DUF1559 domain-containing protein [Phycisphaerae bacterium]
MDVLVSMAVVALLVGLTLPSMTMVRETTHRVVCSSNARQLGLGVAMYSDDYKGWIPRTAQDGSERQDDGSARESLIIVRLGAPLNTWDGLGWLYKAYLSAPGVYYCPSHWGNHDFSKYAKTWDLPPNGGEIVANYQYRGDGADGVGQLFRMDPRLALVADGMRDSSDYNHRNGTNVFHADMSVAWFSDPTGRFTELVSRDNNGGNSGDRIGDLWRMLDGGKK